jgi:hypothetical protein
MTRAEELTVLTAFFTIVLLMWTPVFIDLYRHERKINKRMKGNK